MVSIGAITAAPAKALPSDLEDFVQSAGEHGVVYASLGTTAIPGAPESSCTKQAHASTSRHKFLYRLTVARVTVYGRVMFRSCFQ